MKPITCVEDVPPAIERRVRARYADQVDAMEQSGFHELCCYSELLGDYSLLLSLGNVIFMRMKREVLYRRRRLQAAAAFLLLRHTNPETIALPDGDGREVVQRVCRRNTGDHRQLREHRGAARQHRCAQAG